MSTPIIFGAGLLRLKDILAEGLRAGDCLVFAIGFAAAAVSGYLAIGFLMKYLQTRTLNAFAVYRFCFVAVAALMLLLR
jgi:undecaprenyl-diphosphatase